MKENYKTLYVLKYILYNANNLGIWLWCENNKLKYRYPKNIDYSEIITTLKSHKNEILEILKFNNITKNDFILPFVYKTSFKQTTLSFAQQRLWFIEQYEHGTNAYHIPVVLELAQGTDVGGVKQALNRIVERHQVLRSTIEQGDAQQGAQVVHPGPLAIEESVLADDHNLERLVKTDIDRPFDLEREYPIRARLYHVPAKEKTPKRTVLLVNTHHIASDGWSMEIFQKELLTFYEAFADNKKDTSLPPLEIQYKDYAVWQRSYLSGEVLEEQLNYWKDKLQGYENLELPTDFPRPKDVDYSGGQHGFALSKETSDGLRQLARERATTMHSVLLGAVNILLGKHAGQNDITTGSPIANRHLRQTRDLIGFFVNTQVNRTKLHDDQSFEQLIDQVHRDQVAAQLNQDLPFERLVDELKIERDTSRHPLFQVSFIVQNFGGNVHGTIGTKEYFRPFQGTLGLGTEKFDLSFFIDDGQEQITGQLSYASSLFKKRTIERLASHYVLLIERLLEAPHKPYSQISMLSPEEHDLVVNQWNRTDRAFPDDKTVHRLFEEQAEKTPDSTALVFEGKEMSYTQLNQRANQLAKHIRQRYSERTGEQMQADTLVPLCLERGLEMVVAIIAVMKAGGAYVPIDPSYPRERALFILEDTKAELVVSQKSLAEEQRLGLPKEKLVLADLDGPIYREQQHGNLEEHSRPNDLAYVIYTSGTTGTPKGVMVEHTNISSLVFNNFIHVANEDVFAFLSSPSFDAAIFEIWTPLLNGNILIIPQDLKTLVANTGKFNRFMKLNGVSVLWLTKALFEYLYALDNTIFKPLNYLIIGGEALDGITVNKLASSGERPKTFLNGYGPTESTTFTCVYNLYNKIESLNVPIGAPINNRKAYVLDTNRVPVPIGAIGELYIGGAGLARGYLNRPGLTEERFLPNPFASREDTGKGYDRLYRTGDLVRWTPDGDLEFIGRNDHQVKIRGHRVELGEVEHALSRVPGIKQACVLARERQTEAGTTKYLAGYFVADRHDDPPAQDTIFEGLAKSLPDHMVPSALVLMEAFPLTVNGKLDRRAMPEPEFAPSEKEYTAPETPLEKTLCRIWQEVLGVERVGTTDDFFRTGGNSILAIRASHMMSKALEREIRVADIFRHRSIQRMAAHAVGRQQVEIPNVHTDRPALSFAQQRLWFIEQYEHGTNAYHIPVVLELAQGTDVGGVKQALNRIVERHQVLRSTIEQGDAQQGAQVVHPGPLAIEESVLADDHNLERLVKTDIDRPFDLEREYPIRARLYHVPAKEKTPKRTVLLVNTHHIASDGWSMEIFQKELLTFYEAFADNKKDTSLPPLEIQYKDYAVWQRSYLSGEVLEEQLNYWKDKLQGYENLELPTDFPRPKDVDYSGGQHGFALSKETSDGLRQLARERATTMHSVLLGAVNILLGKHAGQNDITTGSPIANRHLRQTRDLIGFFVNTQVNRTKLHDDQSFEQLIDQVHRDQVAAQLNQDLPFERLVDELKIERDTSRHPLFQVSFIVQNFGGNVHGTIGTKEYFRPFQGTLGLGTEKFDLSFFIDDGQEQITGQLSYASSLFKKRTIERLASHYVLLIERLLEAPHKPYSQISMLSPEEHDLVVNQWNRTDRAFPDDKTVHRLFEEQAEKTPDSTALVFEGKEMSYTQLNQRANQLAKHIRQRYSERTGEQMQADTLVPLCLERGLEMVVAIIAVMKAGGAYVPIDPSYPRERALFILEDTKAELVVSQKSLAEEQRLGLPKEKLVLADLDGPIYREQQHGNLEEHSRPNDLAYVIYTSGTTGTPKGVMVEHKGVVNRIQWMQSMYPLNSKDVILQKTPYTFDVSVWEILWANWYGAKIILARPGGHKDSEYLNSLIKKNKVTSIHFVPSMLEAFNQFLHEKQTEFNVSLKNIFSSGEALNRHIVDQTYKNSKNPRFKLHNLYGPTEASIDVTYFETSPNERVYIGRPIDNTRAYVLDTNRVPVPIGAIGELYIGGAGLARGYLNRPGLTEERFLPNPFASREDTGKGYDRLYRTGDLVRWTPDGNLEFIGRNDHQVKIRGHRVELGEVEHALSRVPGIKQACVLARERQTEAGTTKYLAGYFVADRHDDPPAQDTIFEGLAKSLPDHMVPSALVLMEAFPLTVNGKLDRRAMPEPEFAPSEKEYTAPETPLEKTLCRIWQEVLGVERVGTTDDFFRTGGDSILAIQVSSRVRQEGIDSRVKDIFSHRTVQKLAAHLDANRTKTDIKSEQGPLGGTLGLLPVQKWFAQQAETGQLERPEHWNQSFLVKVPELDRDRLNAIVKTLAGHHDVLRARYQKGKEWQQAYQTDMDIPEVKTLDVAAHGEEEVQRTLTRWQSGFDLEHGPLFQIGYLYGYPDGSARVFFALHHMIVDGVSWRILARDLKTLYEGGTLPLKGTSYRQWADTVRTYPEQYPEERAYWDDLLSGMPTYQSLEDHKKRPSATAIELDEALTKSLLQKAPEAYSTEVNDLLLTALAYALRDISGENPQAIALEGHGREHIDPSVDHSRTVGWFTAMFPVKLEVRDSLKESIRHIKETLRNIPNKGIGFGAFAMEEGGPYGLRSLPPISFNYLGQFANDHSSLWQIASEASGMSVHPSNSDHNLVNINGMVSDGKLAFSVATRLGGRTTQRLAQNLKRHLAAIIEHCVLRLEQRGRSHTPSDFKSVRLSQALLDKIQAEARADHNEPVHIYPANSLQQGFIYHALSQEGDDAYRVQLLLDYRLRLNTDLYIKAWEACIAQYPILRTAFNWEEEVAQVIYKHGKLQYQVHDISHLKDQKKRDERIDAIQKEDRQRGFDLNKPTLLRLHIIKQAEDHYSVLKTEHHSIADGWSGPILLKTLHEHYQNLLEDKKISLKEDTAYPQAQEYINANKASAAQYWERALTGVDEANDINPLLDKAMDLHTYRRVEIPKTGLLTIGGNAYNDLKALGSREGVTTNVILQFAWHKMLQAYSNNMQSVVGTTVSGRDLPIKGIENSVGLYINTLPLAVDWDNNGTVRSQLQHIQQQVTALNTHSFAGLAKLQKNGRRLFHSLMVFENYPLPKNGSEDQSKISLKGVVEKVDYPLSIQAYEYNDALIVKLEYDSAHMGEDRALKLLKKLESVIEQVVKDPGQPHSQISMLSPEEHDLVVNQWNRTDRAFPDDKTVHRLFEEQAEKTPDSTALVFEGKEMSYTQLNQRANQLAKHIRQRYSERTGEQMQADTLVPLCLERGLEMVVAIIAVMKAGGAYVPIDPSYPRERALFILEDTKAELVVSQKSLAEEQRLGLPKEKLVLADLDGPIYREQQHGNLEEHSRPNDLAYVIYTSGTTGTPKGVMQLHCNVMRLFTGTNHQFGFNSKDIWTLFHSYVFDFSVWELWGALFHGGRLIVISKELTKDLEAFHHLCKKYRVSVLSQTPSVFYSLSDIFGQSNQSPVNLRYVIFGGEALNVRKLNPWWTYQAKNNLKTKLINMYGITETTVHVTYKELTKDETLQSNIGKPLADLKAYVLDTNRVPVPIGAIGELYIGGAGLARGYLNRPGLTEERFLPNPFASREDTGKGYDRLYRTGDLVRWTPDGDLEFIGRNDHQVKIRGHRVELGEVEHALSRVPGIKQACVLARERQTEAGTTKYLAGYFVADRHDDPPAQDTIFEGLAKSLPDHMVPSALVLMEAFPLTVNGKLDRRAMPEPEFAPSEKEYTAPETPLEKTLCRIWQEVLGVERVGTTDDFFRTGGDSILSIRIVSKIKRMGLNVTVKDLFKYKTIQNILRHVDINSPKKEIHYSPFSLTDNKTRDKALKENSWQLSQIQDVYPASYLQSGMLIESLKANDVYHDVFSYGISSGFERTKFEKVWSKLTARNEQLRTAFIESENGYLNVVHRSFPISSKIKIVNPNIDLEQLINTEKYNDFNIANPGLFRLLIQPNIIDDSFTLIFSFHHAITDGWSVTAILSQFLSNYIQGKDMSTNIVPPYGKVIFKEIEALKNKNYKQFWIDYLLDYNLKSNNLISNHKSISSQQIIVHQELSEVLNRKILDLSKILKISPDTIFLGTYNLVLSLFYNTNDLVIGTVSNNRLEEEGGDRIFGLHLNTIPLRFKINRNSPLTGKEYLSSVFSNKLEINEYRIYPYGKIKSDLGLREDLYQCVFNYVHFHITEKFYRKKNIHRRVSYEKTSFPLILNVHRQGDSFSFTLDGNENFIDQHTIYEISKCIIVCLKQIMDAPNEFINNYKYLGIEEHDLVVNQWNRTDRAFPDDKTVHRLFEEQAEKTPDSTALVFEGKEMSYTQLNQRANQLAKHIRQRYSERTGEQMQADTLVPLCLERGLEMVVAIIAVMKAGGAYVPIDPSYPRERALFILEDTKAELVVSQKSLAEEQHLGLPKEKLVLADLDGPIYREQQHGNLEEHSRPNDLAYVIYTSGTTGTPKGVMVEHKGVVNRIQWMQSMYPLNSKDVILQKTPYTFDVSVWEILWANWYGAKIILARPGGHKDSEYLNSLIKKNKVTSIHFVPSMLEAFNQFLHEKQTEFNVSLKNIFSSGEALNRHIVDQTYKNSKNPRFKLHNLYGPTEASIDVTYFETSPNERVYIGRPIDNTRAYVLDTNRVPVPIGAIGELYIGGAGLARGYLNRPGLTEERFLPNPFASREDTGKGYDRLYRTGDLVRWTPDGDLEFIGRNDHQVKIRGHRVELGEVEHALSRVPGIKQACVLARERQTEAGTTKYLAGYFVADRHDDPPAQDTIFEGLAKSLPDHMVPSALVLMEAFPLTVNGKLDRRAMPEPEFAPSEKEYTAPETPLEKTLCRIWQEVLGVERVGTTDDFFRTGGDSILAIKLRTQINNTLLTELSIKDLFNNTTILQISRLIIRKQ